MKSPFLKQLAPVLACAAFTLCTAQAKTWYVDPVKGQDSAAGTKDAPWQSFEPVNKLTLKAGDKVVVHPGKLTASLAPKGGGSAKEPVTITFRPGTYEWEPAKLTRRKLAISNTSDRIHEDKVIGMELDGLKHVAIKGKDSLFLCHGKMVQIHMLNCKDIRLSGLEHDYVRPTVNEYTAVEVTPEYADFQIHKDSTYTVQGGNLTWQGEGWTMRGNEGWVQTVAPDRKRANRGGPFLQQGRIEELEPGKIRVRYDKNPGYKKDATYWQLVYTRDCCGVFCDSSSGISYKDMTFRFMHGMGIVSQFTKDISFKNLVVEPRKDSGRTSAAWADILHFSGCSGQINVEDCLLSSANDDAINVHGTHLRITKIVDDRHLVVRFMHRQTFNFNAFRPGDEVQYTADDTLLSLGTGKVKAAKLSGDGKEMELEMEQPVPAGITEGKVVLENVTATPAVTVRNTMVRMITTRGFLFTTRRKIVLDNVYFDRTGMPALLMEDDCDGWYESGPVQDMTVKNCTFDHCAEPVLDFNPHVHKHGGPVHGNITVTGNRFIMNNDCVLHTKSTANLLFKDNKVELPGGKKMQVRQENSENIQVQE